MALDVFTIIVVSGMTVGFIAIILLGIFHPRSGADLLEWRPTRSPEVEAQNEIDDVAQMIAAQNRMRERSGKAPRTVEEVEAQVREQQRELTDYADAYWAEQRETRVAELNAEGGFVVYEVPSCSKCQRLARILGEREIDFRRVDITTAPPTAAQLAVLFEKAGVGPRQALRENAPGASELYARKASDAEILAAMAADPALIIRPIVERGPRAVIARPTERALELL
jgi:arsenate reductase